MSDTVFFLASKHKLLDRISLFLVGWGAIARLVQYIGNRSLWGDEANLALNIIDRSYGELSGVLDHNQAAPLGFLWLEKLAVQIGGNNEYALRLLPFVASLISLIVFYRLVRQYCSPVAAPIAIALFAGGRYTLYFANELKPYSSDVAIALVSFWLLVKVRRKILTKRQIIAFACWGSMAIWLSYPAIFVLGGLAGWNLATASPKLWRKLIVNRLGIYAAWLLSFGLFYYLTIANTLSNEDLSSSWESRYPDSWRDILWVFDALGRFFYHPMGFSGISDGIGIFAFIVGCFVWYRRDRTIWLAFIAPIIATLVAAYLHQYPFRDRLILFLAPLAMAIVAEGIAEMLARLKRVNWAKANRIIAKLFCLLGMVCFVALVIPTMYRMGHTVVRPKLKHEVKPVLDYAVRRVRPQDKIYVYTEGNAASLYYTKLNNYLNLDITYGSTSFARKGETLAEKHQQLATELQPLKGHRVWFVLRADPPEEREILQYLDRIGQRQDSFQQTGASAYLYAL